jgi:type II secretion system protein G
MLKLHKNKGFTLIELLVVISIIGLLSVIVISSLSSAKVKAQNTKFIADMNQLKMAFELYRNDKGFYPGENQVLGVDTVSITESERLPYLQGELVPKYISSISQLYVPEYTHYISGPAVSIWEGSLSCGGVVIKNYVYFLLNSSSLSFSEFDMGEGVLHGFYCIGQ